MNGEVVIFVREKDYAVWWHDPKGLTLANTQGMKLATFDLLVCEDVVKATALAICGQLNVPYAGKRKCQ